MYNRYIPQPDGTHRRNSMQEPQKPPIQPHPQIPDAPNCDPCEETKKSNAVPYIPQEPQYNSRSAPCNHPPVQGSIPNFFKQLLPRNLETADLLIVILLLLMVGDCEENRNNALLTLALYFFM